MVVKSERERVEGSILLMTNGSDKLSCRIKMPLRRN